jgi:hypothetical protein
MARIVTTWKEICKITKCAGVERKILFNMFAGVD